MAHWRLGKPFCRRLLQTDIEFDVGQLRFRHWVSAFISGGRCDS